jgi:hypothetical protein
MLLKESKYSEVRALSQWHTCLDHHTAFPGSGDDPTQSVVSFHQAIFNHLKTIYISPSAIASPSPQRMKVQLALDEFGVHHFYRLLLFPSMSAANPHRVCELLSVYLIFQDFSPMIDSSPVSGSHVPSPLSSASNRTPLNRSTLKSLFHRNQKIHIGLSPLSSIVLTALFPSEQRCGETELTPKIVESLVSKWITKQEEQQRDRPKNNPSIVEAHLIEIDWLSRSIDMIRRMCTDETTGDTTRRRSRTQREGPYLWSSLSKMRERLIQVLLLIHDPYYLAQTALPQAIHPLLPQDYPQHHNMSPLFSLWIQTEMSAQDILQAYYLPNLPALKHVQYSSPSHLLNLPPHHHQDRSQSQDSGSSLIRQLFMKLWIETCTSHSRPGDGDTSNIIFHFHCHSVHPMRETSVAAEVSLIRDHTVEGRQSLSPELLFLLHQHLFYPSLQKIISSLSDFQLLFHSDTYHTVSPPCPPAVPPPTLPSPPPPMEEVESDDESIPDLDVIVEQAISEFISKDGFDEGSSIENQRIGRRSAKASLPSPEEILAQQSTNQSLSTLSVPLPPRKMRSILSLLSSLPTPVSLSSSSSLDSQLFKVSEVLISSSIIAFHHLLKYDRHGKVWF